MAQKAKKTPFRWSMALVVLQAGAAVAILALALLSGVDPSIPVLSYVFAGIFGACFAFLMYLARNNENKSDATEIYDPAVGNMADFHAGTGTSSWGAMGQAIAASDKALEASRRND